MTRILTRDSNYYRNLIRLALPVAAQGLILFAASFADNLMVSSLGDESVSGVYFASQVNIFVQMFASGISGAIIILSAQYWGQDNRSTIKKIVSIGLRISTVVGGIISLICLLVPEAVMKAFTTDPGILNEAVTYLRTVALSYVFLCVTQALLSAMRAVENPGIGTKISLLSLTIDIALNFLFIFTFRWGVFGAALSTLIGRMIEMIAISLYLLLRDKKLALNVSDLRRYDKDLLSNFIRYGLPLVAGEIVWSVNLIGNSIIIGQFFDASVATAVSITNTMNTMAYISISGFASAVGIITGKTVGAGKYELMKQYAKTTQVLFLVMGMLAGLLVIGLRSPFINLYSGMFGGGISQAAATQAYALIGVLSVTIVGSGFQAPCLFGLVKSGGDITFVFKNDAIFVFGVVLPSAIISASLGAPVWVVFLCLKSDQLLKCIVAVIKVNRFNWMKNLTRNEVSPL